MRPIDISGLNRLPYAMIAWGDETKIGHRIEAQYKAGATHVSITCVRSEGSARQRAVPDALALGVLPPAT
jgi:hypothetical protein